MEAHDYANRIEPKQLPKVGGKLSITAVVMARPLHLTPKDPATSTRR